MNGRYRLSAAGLRFAAADPHVAIFDPATGRTHIVTDLAHALLQAAQEPGSLAELEARIAALQPLESDDGEAVTDVLAARVEELRALGLVELVS